MNWPHGPAHRLGAAGAYMVTAGTLRKEAHFRGTPRLNLLCDALLALADKYGWQMQAWAVFPNHYHFVALSPEKAESLRALIRHLHSVTAKAVNQEDRTSERKVWHQYWESFVRGEKSYLARLSYVHHNAVRHRLVKEATNYPWSSAGWFKLRATNAFYRTVMEFPHARVTANDDFDVTPFEW